jgi:hypothetical protein
MEDQNLGKDCIDSEVDRYSACNGLRITGKKPNRGSGGA